MADDALKRKAPEESREEDTKVEEPTAKKPETAPVPNTADPVADTAVPAAASTAEGSDQAAPTATPAATPPSAPSAPAASAAEGTAAAAPAAAARLGAREKPAGTDEPESKRLKPTPPDPKAVRKQVEYYLSDENLKYDKFFSEKISGDADGWLDMQLVLSCNKMKSIRATKEDVVEALKGSKIEVREGGSAVRRPGNAPLPQLETRPTHPKKSSIHAHDGGVIAAFSGIPEEQSWTQVKEKLKEKLPGKVQLWFVSEVNDKNQCFVAVSPFDGDQRFFEELDFEMSGRSIKSEVCQGELLQGALKLIPKHVRDKRERESKKRQKERNRPILVGTQRFINVAALRGRVKEILNSRSDGEQLKPDGSDFKLIKALLGWHPKGDEKSQGLIGMKVAKSSKGDSRCFYMIKEGGVEEDFSAKKCLDAIEQKPPYEPKKEAGSSAATAKAEEKPVEARKTKDAADDEPEVESKPAEKVEAKPSEERKAEEKAAPEERKAMENPEEEVAPEERKEAEQAAPEERKEEDKPEEKAVPEERKAEDTAVEKKAEEQKEEPKA